MLRVILVLLLCGLSGIIYFHVYRCGVKISEPLSIILACSSGYAINTRCVGTCYHFLE